MSNALETKTMNRQQRRAQKKNIDWVNSLSRDKQEIINRVVQERAAAMNLAEMVNFQMSFSAALITLHEEKFNMNDIQELIILANKYSDDREYIKKYGMEWMIMFEKQREDMKKEMGKLYESGVKSQNAMVKAIKLEKRFKDIAQKDIVVVYKELKDELSGIRIKEMNESKEDVEKAVEYIFSDENKKEKVEEKLKLKEIPNEINMPDEIIELGKVTWNGTVEVKSNKVTGILEGEFFKVDTEIEDLSKKRAQIDTEINRKRVKQSKLSEAIKILKNIDM